MTDYIDKTCEECAYFTGEECDGKQEGSEKYDDSNACDGFDEKGEVK